MPEIGIELFAEYMRLENKYFESKNYQLFKSPDQEVKKKYLAASEAWMDFKYWNKNLAEEIEAGW